MFRCFCYSCWLHWTIEERTKCHDSSHLWSEKDRQRNVLDWSDIEHIHFVCATIAWYLAKHSKQWSKQWSKHQRQHKRSLNAWQTHQHTHDRTVKPMPLSYAIKISLWLKRPSGIFSAKWPSAQLQLNIFFSSLMHCMFSTLLSQSRSWLKFQFYFWYFILLH